MNAKLNTIKVWMKNSKLNYIDECGELDITKLAEDAIVKFNVDGDDEEPIFEYAASL
jgi:hypothetical protein